VTTTELPWRSGTKKTEQEPSLQATYPIGLSGTIDPAVEGASFTGLLVTSYDRCLDLVIVVSARDFTYLVI
jgi:hypothetical protein